VETIELKWGQGAKCIGGEIKVNSLDRAIELKKRGYIVTPDPEDPAHQAAFKAGPLEQFERHSRLGFVDQEGFMNEVDKKLLFTPAKAANAGGVAVSGLEMAQNRMLLKGSAEEVDQRLRSIMKNIHRTCLDVAAEYGEPGNYLAGANIAGFVRVVNAMLDQGLV
jgi:hypothetical protein